MTTVNATNGKAPARKQLSDQLDRLDSLLETMGAGLHAAVADACREGTRAAVREVLMELISNPDLLATVRPPIAPVAVPVPSEPPTPPTSATRWSRVRTSVKSATQAMTAGARTLVKSVKATVQPATDALKLTGTTQTIVGVAIGVGLTAGALSLICPSWVGALLTAGASSAAIGAAHVGAAMSRLFAGFRLA